ncbi:MAG: hypothetical protein LBO04_05625 [Spirochaetaceae bacterium]|jgi:hypothetical protein|nr:hypothetical protein [Spirochaetaceae bacterium]
MKRFLLLLPVCFCFAVAGPAARDTDPRTAGDAVARGEEAIAARYVEWAADAFREKRFSQAEAFLLRAADYASVSSDLSYLLALVKKELSAPVREALAAARLALATDRWVLYSREDAVYVEVWALIRLGRCNEALDELAGLGENERTAELRLSALGRLPGTDGFYTALAAALEKYPYEPAFPRLLFRRAAVRDVPAGVRERALVDTALKRLPALLRLDGDLVVYAAPLMADRDEARRLLAAWRVSGGAARELRAASLPVSLDTGLIGEDEALDELFAADDIFPQLDRDTLLAVWELLRTEAARDEARRRLAAFSGVITTDGDGDGVVNARAEYRDGRPVAYSLDEDQDGIDELLVVFEAAWPVSAELAYADGGETDSRERVFVVWEKYPALREAARGKTRYLFRPMDFNYPAVRFETLCGPDGLLLPLPEKGLAMFTEYLALANAYGIERPGSDFPGSVERIECEGGVIFSVKEYLDGRLVAETSYERGLPVYQRIDLDLDGRMETVRRFKRTEASFSAAGGYTGVLPGEPEIEVIESDWDGDGFSEYREEQ